MRIVSILSFFILCLHSFDAFTQNLIYNGDFESYSRCPEYSSNIIFANYWDNANASACDYYNACSISLTKQTTIPTNCMGYQKPHSGQGYAGIGCRPFPTNSSFDDSFDFLLAQTGKLVKDKLYCIELFVSLADKEATYCIDKLSLVFCTNTPEMPSSKYLRHKDKGLVIYAYNKDGSLLSDTANWVLISALYKAKGGETNLIIGFPFMSNSAQWVSTGLKLNSQKMSTYYFIDDVSVKMVPDRGQCQCYSPEEALNSLISGQDFHNKTYSLRNINFPSDSYLLQRSDLGELDSLAMILIKDRTLSIRIVGHTDYSGSHENAIRLAENRAWAVANYLVEKGVIKTRIKIKSSGVTNTIVHDKTTENQNNRRVEIIFD